MKFCPNCGDSIQNNIKHCPNCGEKINSEDVVESDLNKTQNNPKNKKNTITIVIILVLIGCNFLFRPKTCDIMGDKSLIEVAEIIKNGDYPSFIYTYSVDALIYFIGNSKKGQKFNKEYILGYVFSDCLGLINKKTKNNSKKEKLRKGKPIPTFKERKERERLERTFSSVNELFDSCYDEISNFLNEKGFQLVKVYIDPYSLRNELNSGRMKVNPNEDFILHSCGIEVVLKTNYRVIAPRGLNYRDKPISKNNNDSQVLGKFNFNEKLKLLQSSNIQFQVEDYDSLGNKKGIINGEWVKVISLETNKSGYVFDGYLESIYQENIDEKDIISYFGDVNLKDCSITDFKKMPEGFYYD